MTHQYLPKKNEKFTAFIGRRIAHHAECCKARKGSAHKKQHKHIVEAIDSYGHIRLFDLSIFTLRPIEKPQNGPGMANEGSDSNNIKI